MAKMDDYQLSSIVSSEIEDSLNHFDSEYTQERLRAIDFYLGEPLGNEQAGKSSVVDTTFADTVETIMPNLMRVFTSNDQYVRFAPRTAEDVKGAEQATDMANFVINHDNAGYKVLHTWFKDALMFRLGVVKYFWDETEEVNEEVPPFERVAQIYVVPEWTIENALLTPTMKIKRKQIADHYMSQIEQNLAGNKVNFLV